MPAVTIVDRREIPPGFGMEVLQVTVAADADTYSTRLKIREAIFQPSRASAAADSWGLTWTAGGQTITFKLIGTTALSGSLIIFGDL